MKTFGKFQDLYELAKRGRYTLMLDENLSALETGLENAGYKVVVTPKGWDDEKIKKLAAGWTIITKNSKHFVNDACRYDYDVLAMEKVRFVDAKPDGVNATVVKIDGALRRSKLGSRKGNFLLALMDDGSFRLKELLV